MDHVARLMDLSMATAERDWRIARAWLEKQYDLAIRSMVREEVGS
jgi:hypothetical protein